MLNIEFCDLETQNAIYKVACKYEGFIVDTLSEVLEEEQLKLHGILLERS